jgi:hypothetical protein
MSKSSRDIVTHQRLVREVGNFERKTKHFWEFFARITDDFRGENWKFF